MPYAKEAVAVIAGLLREAETGPAQKVLADGLRYAPSLSQADLQGCNLAGAYLGQKTGDRTIVDLTNADLFRANLTGAFMKGISATGAVFREATLVRTVLTGADLTDADFQDAKLDGAKFDGARIGNARFSGASDIPADVAGQLNAEGNAVAPAPADTSEEGDLTGWWTSPWLQVEAGMAVMLGLPLLVAPEEGVAEGVFSPSTWGSDVHGTALSSPGTAGTRWLELIRARLT